MGVICFAAGWGSERVVMLCGAQAEPFVSADCMTGKLKTEYDIVQYKISSLLLKNILIPRASFVEGGVVRRPF